MCEQFLSCTADTISMTLFDVLLAFSKNLMKHRTSWREWCSYLSISGRVIVVNKGEHPRAWHEQRDLDVSPHDCSRFTLFRVSRFSPTRLIPSGKPPHRKSFSFTKQSTHTRDRTRRNATKHHNMLVPAAEAILPKLAGCNDCNAMERPRLSVAIYWWRA